ncbi:glycoside hydrolase family 105 protein [Paenibacillus sp. GCM10027626]|uniref:glycoside hydrolase family 88/105 protein n=1 Tax=Paenibacillus sp. GCM10027626 TaxID=3273411 RepID=UPI003632930A
MNEKMEQGKSIFKEGVADPAEVIARVTERLLETRPREEIRLRPYMEQPIKQHTPFGPYQVDFAACWPEAEEGSVAYAAARFHAGRDQDVIMTVRGCAKLWFNGEMYAGTETIPVKMKQGWNDLLLQCVRDSHRWGFDLLIGFPRYPNMWAKDYLFSTRPTYPQQALRGEEGFAYIGPIAPGIGGQNRCASLEAEALSGQFVSWQPDAAAEPEPQFADFAAMYGPDAVCAYGMTFYTKPDSATLMLQVEHEGLIKVWMDGKEVYRSASAGRTQIAVQSSNSSGQVLIKCVRRKEAGRWGFKADITDMANGQRADGIPDLESSRGDSSRWLYTGPFSSPGVEPEALLDCSFAVESAADGFEHLYATGEGEAKTYWRLSSPNTYVRPYMEGFFFGQWFYAIQVGLYGLLEAAKTLGLTEVIRYATDSMAVMARYHEYALWDAERYGVPSLIPRAQHLEELDPCGTIGVMMIEVYKRTGCSFMLPVIERISEAVMNAVPRMDDGTFYRIETMWADDFFMSCPFLVRMGQLTGDTRYFEEVIRQANGFHSRLWLADKRLYAHIYYPAEGVNSGVPWGRGNGWVLFALTEILLHLPDDYPGRDMLLRSFKEFAAGVASYQNESGMWHQVLDESVSYEETSCTAMFVLSLARGIRMGWLGDEFLEVVTRGWLALLRYCVDAEGNVYGVCLGSGFAKEASYYFDIPTYMNDDHGTGVVLLAAAEMIALADGGMKIIL